MCFIGERGVHRLFADFLCTQQLALLLVCQVAEVSEVFQHELSIELEIVQFLAGLLLGFLLKLQQTSKVPMSFPFLRKVATAFRLHGRVLDEGQMLVLVHVRDVPAFAVVIENRSPDANITARSRKLSENSLTLSPDTTTTSFDPSRTALSMSTPSAWRS